MASGNELSLAASNGDFERVRELVLADTGEFLTSVKVMQVLSNLDQQFCNALNRPDLDFRHVTTTVLISKYVCQKLFWSFSNNFSYHLNYFIVESPLEVNKDT